MSDKPCPHCKQFKLKLADSDEMYRCVNCNYWWYTDELS